MKRLIMNVSVLTLGIVILSESTAKHSVPSVSSTEVLPALSDESYSMVDRKGAFLLTRTSTASELTESISKEELVPALAPIPEYSVDNSLQSSEEDGFVTAVPECNVKREECQTSEEDGFY